MNRFPIVAFLTDFGADSHYVGQMKGRVLEKSPGAQLVDITHSISPQDISEAAFVLRDCIEAFPSKTIFVGVVDPGVGSQRRIVSVSANNQWFVMPDNGLITEVQRSFGVGQVFDIDQSKFDATATFHGRDIMAPLAGMLASDEDLRRWGIPIDPDDLMQLPVPVPTSKNSGKDPEALVSIEGRVVYVDRFGNLITDIRLDSNKGDFSAAQVKLDDSTIGGICRTYYDRRVGELTALIGSHGRLEIAVRNGNASKATGSGKNARVQVSIEK